MVVVALGVCLVGVVTLVVVRGIDDDRPITLRVPPSSSPSPSASPAASAPTCPGEVSHSFVPAAITVPGVARRVQVIAPPRDSHDVPGIPPLTEAGKHVFAFDPEQGVSPGDPHGNVLLNAHTWPDGSALGNQLLAGLQRHDRIVVEGRRHLKLCYRVTDRVEVLATTRVPSYYSTTGRPQLAIVVCSGRRLGPGEWEKRTIWYASPAA